MHHKGMTPAESVPDPQQRDNKTKQPNQTTKRLNARKVTRIPEKVSCTRIGHQKETRNDQSQEAMRPTKETKHLVCIPTKRNQKKFQTTLQ